MNQRREVYNAAYEASRRKDLEACVITFNGEVWERKRDLESGSGKIYAHKNPDICTADKVWKSITVIRKGTNEDFGRRGKPFEINGLYYAYNQSGIFGRKVSKRDRDKINGPDGTTWIKEVVLTPKNGARKREKRSKPYNTRRSAYRGIRSPPSSYEFPQPSQGQTSRPESSPPSNSNSVGPV